MSNFQRGTVVKATFEIEYPDGSRKVAELDNPEDVGSVVFDPVSVPPGDEGLFSISESDWKQNPTMIVYPKAGSREGIPFCTHNGCKG
jgi:hypothetical protein